MRLHDQLEIIGRIEVEPLFDAEARAHRRGEHAESRRGADQRERLDRHRDRLRLRSLGQPNVDLVVLHRRIEELFDDRLEAMDLVDEQDVAGAQVGERPDEIARLLERRPGARADVDAQLARDQLGERRLAESRRSEEQRVIERLTPGERRVDEDPQAVLHLLLPDELREPLRPERQLDRGLVGQHFGCRDLGSRHGGKREREAVSEAPTTASRRPSRQYTPKTDRITAIGRCLRTYTRVARTVESIVKHLKRPAAGVGRRFPPTMVTMRSLPPWLALAALALFAACDLPIPTSCSELRHRVEYPGQEHDDLRQYAAARRRDGDERQFGVSDQRLAVDEHVHAPPRTGLLGLRHRERPDGSRSRRSRAAVLRRSRLPSTLTSATLVQGHAARRGQERLQLRSDSAECVGARLRA